jgi:hypothetical protein
MYSQSKYRRNAKKERSKVFRTPIYTTLTFVSHLGRWTPYWIWQNMSLLWNMSQLNKPKAVKQIAKIFKTRRVNVKNGIVGHFAKGHQLENLWNDFFEFWLFKDFFRFFNGATVSKNMGRTGLYQTWGKMKHQFYFLKTNFKLVFA